jgi:hypothetical protein
MNQYFPEIPLMFLSPGDAIRYWYEHPLTGSPSPGVRELMYEMMVVMKPLLKPQGLIRTFSMTGTEVELGGQRLVLPTEDACSQVSFLVSTLGAHLDAFIAELLESSGEQAAVADAIAWQAAEQALHFLAEALVQQAWQEGQQIRKYYIDDDFFTAHKETLLQALQTEKIGVGPAAPQKTLWGLAGWVEL